MDLTQIVIVDTETTGLKKKDEVVEIAIVDGKTGLPLLNTLVKPTIPICPFASNVHGITDAMVADAPTWAEIHDLVVRLFTGVTVVAYNSDFDERLIQQSAKAHGLRMPPFDVSCAMRWIHSYLVTPQDPRMKYPKLTDMAELYGVVTQGEAHRALADVLMTRDVIQAVRQEDQQDHSHPQQDQEDAA